MLSPHDSDQKAAAFHEAGHAFIALCFGWPVASLSILLNDANRTGVIHLVNLRVPAKSEPLRSIAFLLSGYCAELMACGHDASHLESDWWPRSELDRCEASDISLKLLNESDWAPRKNANRRLVRIAKCVFGFIHEPSARGTVEVIAQSLIAAKQLDEQQIEAIWREDSVPGSVVSAFCEQLRVASRGDGHQSAGSTQVGG